MPPKATAIKPALVKKLLASNCNDMIGATAAPPIAPMSAASPKLNSVRRATSTPMNRAASGFSAHAVSALPTAVRTINSQMPMMMTQEKAAIHSPCDGTRMPNMSIGCSPESAVTA